jgi:hypothetical protein
MFNNNLMLSFIGLKKIRLLLSIVCRRQSVSRNTVAIQGEDFWDLARLWRRSPDKSG